VRGVVLHLDESRGGSGFRPWLVLTEGPKWTTVFYPSDLRTEKLEKREFEISIRRDLTDAETRRLIALAKRTARERKALGMKTPKKALKLLG
jgi:hypothetical protein